MMKDNFYSFLSQPVDKVAPALLGCTLLRVIDGQQLIGKIVETEAYDQLDAASHSYRGKTSRNAVTFGKPGHLYVYFTYGMHYCCNVVCGPEGYGAAVLIRALEPLKGQDMMSLRRHGLADQELTNGPAKICQALSINTQLNGHDLRLLPLRLSTQPQNKPAHIVRTTRVGISVAKDKLLRFYLADNKYVSRPL